MIKALLRKQLLQTAKTITTNPKTGARRGTGGIIGMVLLFVVCWASLAMAFFGMSMALDAFFDVGLGWLYFVMMTTGAFAISVFLSVATVVATVYRAKDNELLLAMPIPPRVILISRLFEVWVSSLVSISIVAVPTLIRWFIRANVTLAGGIFSVLLFFFVSLLAVAVSGLIGWIVAWIASKLRRAKNFMTVFLTMGFLAAYYVFYFRINRILNELVAMGGTLAEKMLANGNPLIHIGRAAEGNVLSFLYIAAIALISFAIFYWLLSRNFLKIATANKGSEKRVYREKVAKAQGHGAALLRKEFGHFLGSPMYMMNAGMGTLLMTAAAVFLAVKMDAARAFLAGSDNVFAALGIDVATYLPLIGGLAIMVLSGMNDLTAPAISIEAKTLWLSRSMPLTAREFFDAKLNLHRILTMIPALLLVAVFRMTFVQISWNDTLFMAVLVLLYIELMATIGLIANVVSPNLTWTNEAAAVKQGFSVFIALCGSMILTLLLGIAYWILHEKVAPVEFIEGTIAAMAILVALLRRWLYTRGAKRYEKL